MLFILPQDHADFLRSIWQLFLTGDQTARWKPLEVYIYRCNFICLLYQNRFKRAWIFGSMWQIPVLWRRGLLKVEICSMQSLTKRYEYIEWNDTCPSLSRDTYISVETASNSHNRADLGEGKFFRYWQSLNINELNIPLKIQALNKTALPINSKLTVTQLLFACEKFSKICDSLVITNISHRKQSFPYECNSNRCK